MSEDDDPFSSLEALLGGGDDEEPESETESEPEVELSDEDEGAHAIRTLVLEPFCVLLTACDAGYS